MLSHRCGFTLIELLMVISIVAVLAGMLLPVISAVQTSARAATFASNLRQVSMASLLYADECDGTLPWTAVTIGATVFHWHDLLRIRLDDANTQNPMTIGWADPAQIRTSLFHDPVESASLYNVAINDTGDARMPRNTYGAAGRTLASIRKMPELMLVGPGAGKGSGFPGTIWDNGTARYVPNAWLASGAYSARIFLRYRNTAPYAYADGHVATVTAAFLNDELARLATDQSPFFGMP
jgi:prepilin-type N-terminal cleavage/methylation domain-containing protein/prepilin-type processing-associated H-X9-DG protein